MAKSTTVRFRMRSPCGFHAFLVIIVITLAVVALLLIYLPSIRSGSQSRLLTDDTELASFFRLPTEIVPYHYDVNLKVYLPYQPYLDYGNQNYTLDGIVQIFVCCEKSTRQIVLNARSLIFDIMEVRVFDEYNRSLAILSFNQYENRIISIVKLDMVEPLTAGMNYMLFMKYHGTVGDVWSGGMFRAFYDDKHGTTRSLAITQMQETDARRVIPCFDEPQLKARFAIRIIHPTGTSVVSNAPVRHSRNVDTEWMLTEFEETPTMSTYLLAIIISDFAYRSMKCRNTEVRVWSSPTKLNDTKHALDVTCRLLLFYEDYFSIAYPLKKLDVFAVPELRVLAMENWGLVTVRERFVVFNERIDCERDKRAVTDVLAHEIAHMWFGNLVTMKWWNDLWLNEGFATMMAPKAADSIENTTLRREQYFSAEVKLKAMRIDQHTSTTQPLSLRGDSEDVHKQERRILYEKGAAVLRMVEVTVGEETFQKALRPYLLKYAYRNAERNDLLHSFSIMYGPDAASEDPFYAMNFTAADFMDTWTYQIGFPVIEVSRMGSTYHLAQQVFDVDGNIPDAQATLQWKVPLFFGSGKKRKVIWLLENETVTVENTGHPFLIDVDSNGYYRVQYDEVTWNDIIEILLENYSSIPGAARSRLLDDSFVLAEAGRIPFKIPLRLSEYLVVEPKVIPIATFLSRLEILQQRLYRHKRAALIDKFIIYLLQPTFDEVMKRHRVRRISKLEEREELILYRICATGHAECVKMFRPYFDELRVSCGLKKLSDFCNRLDPSMRSVVYMVGSRFGNYSDFEFLRRNFETEEYQIERDRIFKALAFSTNHTSIVRLAKYVLSVKERDTDFRPKIYDFTRKNYENGVISNYFHENFHEIFENHRKYAGWFMQQMVQMYVTLEDVKKLDLFETKYRSLSPVMSKIVARFKSEILRRIQWIDRYADDIFKFLATKCV